MYRAIKTTGSLVVLCPKCCCLVLLCVVVCKRGGEVSSVRGFGGIVVSIAAFQAVEPGSIPSQRCFVLQVLKTESDHEFESRSCY